MRFRIPALPAFALSLALTLSLGRAETLLLLPVQGTLKNAVDLATVGGLSRDIWQALYKGSVVFGDDSTAACAEKGCARELATEMKADVVVYSAVRPLGEKLIFSSTLVETATGEVYTQRATAQSVEDLEAVTQRVAEALQARKTLEQVATTENITEKEELSEPVRRRSLYSSGFSLGYLYPQGDSYSNRRSDGSLRQPYSALVRLGWMNRWEFRDDMALNFDAVWSMPTDIGGDIVLQYLLSKRDFTPFVGGGLGIHYVGADDAGYGSEHRDSGPTAIGQAGILLFRTYDIHVVAKAQYQAVFNSDVDHGVAFDVGVIYQPRERHESSGANTGVLGIIGYTLLGFLVLGLVSAATH